MPARDVRTAKPPTPFGSIDEFLAARDGVRGTVEVVLGDLPLHFFYDWRGADTTFVSFSGAASAKVQHVPAWAGDGISRGLGVNRLLISDPSIKLSTELRLAWYAGSTAQPRLQEDLLDLVAAVTSGTRPLLFGPSGGGYAALLQAASLPGAVAVVSNPQTDVFRFTRSAVDRYLHTAWAQELDQDAPPFVREVVSAYAGKNDASVVYLQNAGDADHIEKHYAPFRDAVCPDNNVVYLLPNLGPGHLGPDRDSFVRLLTTVRDHREWGQLVGAVRDLSITRET